MGKWSRMTLVGSQNPDETIQLERQKDCQDSHHSDNVLALVCVGLNNGYMNRMNWIVKVVLRGLLLSALLIPATAIAQEQLSLSQIGLLDGTNTDEVVTLARWRQAVFELRKTGGKTAWPAARDLERAQLASVDRNVIPLGLVYSSYARQTQEGRTVQSSVFSFAPLRRTSYYPLHMVFTISPDAVLGDSTSSPIVSLTLDAGDGQGFRPLKWNQHFPVSYKSGGTFAMTLRAVLEDGSQRTAQSMIRVIEGPGVPAPDATWDITATEEYMGAVGSGQAYVYLGAGNTEIIRPVVVIEGFDIDNSIDWPVLYQLLNQEELLEDLHDMAYDAIVLDFTEAVEPIQRNAFVFTKLIEMVLDEIGPDRSMAVVGASMGGLVGRYGLLWLEDQGIDHQVRNFISFDSPHGGANIPLGLQHWLEFFADEAEEAQFFLDRLNSDAARQMLLYHLSSTSGTTAGPDPLKGSFNSDLSALGDWPGDPRLTTVINGSGSMTDQGFDAGDQIIDWEYDSLLVDVVGNVWAVPDGGSQVIFDGEIDIFIIGGDTQTTTIAGTLPWDNAPGGFRSTMDQLADVPAPYGDILALHGAHSFIPSVAALDLDTTDPFYDIENDPLSLLNTTPFDQAYFPSENQDHIFITPENKDWFIFEIGFGLPSDILQENGFESP